MLRAVFANRRRYLMSSIALCLGAGYSSTSYVPLLQHLGKLLGRLDEHVITLDSSHFFLVEMAHSTVQGASSTLSLVHRQHGDRLQSVYILDRKKVASPEREQRGEPRTHYVFYEQWSPVAQPSLFISIPERA